MRLTTSLTIVMVAAGLAAAARAQAPDRNEVAFHAAMKRETVDGDLKGAIEAYRKLAEVRDHAIAAKSLVRMGECYERLGNAEARKAYERVVRDFPDQKEAAEAARARLAALGKGAQGTNPRLIGKGGYGLGPSPDGRWLLRWATGGALDLRDLKTGQVRRVLKEGANWYSPAISPDGRQVAFFRYQDEDDVRVRGLWVIGSDGARERLLWKTGKGQSAGDAQWFPDGKRLAVRHRINKDLTRLIAVSTVDGMVTTLLDSKLFFTFGLSPDGKSVALARIAQEKATGGELWHVSLEDKKESLLFQPRSYIDYPRWMPDGSGIVFESDRRAPGVAVDLWLLRVSGGKPQGFPQMVYQDLGPMQPVENSWSRVTISGPITRDGTLYFQVEKAHPQDPSAMVQLLTIGFDPETGKVVGSPSFVSRKGGLSRLPNFSRDGRWLLYHSGMKPDTYVLQSFESGNERTIQFDPAPSDLYVLLFPDGESFLVRATHPTKGRGWFKVDVTGKNWTLLHSIDDGWVSGFSPDGKTAIIQRPITGTQNAPWRRVMAWNIETGEERELANNAGLSAVSFDGTQVAISRPDGNDCVIEVLPFSGGARRLLHRFPGCQVADVTWTPDGRYLIVGPGTSRLGNAKSYLRIPVAGGEAQPIGIFAATEPGVQFPVGFGALRVHPNGRQIVYVARGASTDQPPEGEDWALSNFLPGFKAAK